MTDTNAHISATRIVGAVGTGKTEQLVHSVKDALAGGMTASDILVVCATPQAALAFEKRLDAAIGAFGDTAASDAASDPGTSSTSGASNNSSASASGINITNPRSLALSVLSDAEAVRWSGREPRILTAYEELFLLEDMKVTGLRPRRLREMLKFFYRSWTEMADDDEGWLMGGEETNVHSMLKGNLSFTRSILEPEAANLAVNYLRTHAGARAAHGAKLVVVDDYQRLSRASQLLCGLLASERIIIAGDRNACIEVFDSYPYAAGLDEFMDAHSGAEDIELSVCQRCNASATAAKALMGADEHMTVVAFEAHSESASNHSADASEGANGDAALILENASPADEYAAITQTIQGALSDGCKESEIVIAVPNSVWARNLTSALQKEGVPCATLSDRQPVRGDIRDNAKCLPAHVLTALDLVADPKNALAWRDWCGYNDWLANSSAIGNLRNYAEAHSLGILDGLKALAEGAQAVGDGSLEHVVGAQRVVMTYEAGLELLKATSGLEGKELLDALTARISNDEETEAPTIVSKLCVADGVDNSAAAMAARFRETLLTPAVHTDAAVLLVPYDQAAGLSPKLLIVAGFVNGFIPCQAYFDSAEMPLDKQTKEHEKDTRRVYALAGKADEQLVVSYFTKVPLEVAATLKLHIDRIRLENGTRMCKISESIFGEYL